MATNWHPTWWNREHGDAWERVKEAIRRDWQQTKHDLHATSGHELNQGLSDTVKQATGKEPLPPIDRPNPPKVLGDADWANVATPIEYGFGARQRFGTEHPTWNDRLESSLRSEWEGAATRTKGGWDDVRHWVRHGYEYDARTSRH